MLQGLTCTLAAILLAAPAPFGTAVRLGVADMVERSDLCLEGRVTAARAILEPGKRIDTEYTISVERTFWGEPQASRAIRIPGGVLPDGRGMVIPGLSGMATGEDVILFLSKADALGMRMPIGLAQGKMRVATDRFGKKRVLRDQAGLELASTTGTAKPADEAASLEYAAVVAEIDAAVAARRAKKDGK
jgi:hypothetical protein